MLSTNTAGDTTDMEKGAVVAEPESQGKMQALKAQTQGVIDQMKDNLELILEREAKARDLLTKAQDMDKGAQHFKQTSQKVARTYWWKNVKLVVVIVVVVLIVVLIIILLATGVIPTSSPLPPVVKPTIKPPK